MLRTVSLSFALSLSVSLVGCGNTAAAPDGSSAMTIDAACTA